MTSTHRLLCILGAILPISGFSALAQPETAPQGTQPAAGKPGPASTPASTPAPNAEIRKSIVKIFTTSRGPDLGRPWQKRRPQDATGTGVVIDGKRILTNAHVVDYASRVLVQPDQSSDKLIAKVIVTAPGIDLAIIELEDPAFFDTHPAAAFSDGLPEIGSTVEALGYPVGGDALSVTKGIVSRIEQYEFWYGVQGVRIQVDAAINPGNSGGPAVIDGKVVGLVFSGIDSAQNIGYLIPNDEIREFLTDIEDGKYDGKPQLYVPMQTLENPALRRKLDAGKDVQGMLVTATPDDGAAGKGEAGLKQWDIVTHIAGVSLDNSGMVSVRDGLRLDFHSQVSKKARDGKIALTVLREGKSIEIQAPVYRDPPRLLRYLNHTYPEYAVLGPLVFTKVYSDHVEALSAEVLAARKSPIIRRAGDSPKTEGEELVAIAPPFLPHRLTKGYDLTYFAVLRSVNGTKIKSLRHLLETVKASTEPYLTFEWDDEGTETMVFDREELLKSCEEIYEDNGIRSPVSDDLKDVWDKK